MSKIKIAIVEDEQASRDMLARYLHDYSTEENVDLTVTTYIDGDYFLANYAKVNTILCLWTYACPVPTACP